MRILPKPSKFQQLLVVSKHRVKSIVECVDEWPSVAVASKGISANLLKVGSKRRRTKAEIDVEKEEEETKDARARQKDEQLEMLSLRVRELEQANATNQAATEILRDLIARGEAVQNEDGSVQIVRDEHEDSLSEQFQMWSVDWKTCSAQVS